MEPFPNPSLQGRGTFGRLSGHGCVIPLGMFVIMIESAEIDQRVIAGRRVKIVLRNGGSVRVWCENKLS